MTGATFTMRLKDVIENVYGTSYDPHDFEITRSDLEFQGIEYGDLPVLPDAGKQIGLSQYPIFNEEYRDILNGKIIDEYYNREICTETIDDFKLIIRRKMQQIMPYYNKLYESEALEYDPLSTMDIHSQGTNIIDGEETVTGSNVANSKNKSGARAVSSETPQTMLSGSGDYATGGTDTNSESEVDSTAEQNSSSNTDTTSTNDNRVTGFQGVASELVARWRNAQINIDTMILNDIKDCFMLLLNNGDSYSPNYNYYYGWY